MHRGLGRVAGVSAVRVLWAGAGRMHVAPVGAQGAYGGSHLAVAECGGERSECRPAELAPPEPA